MSLLKLKFLKNDHHVVLLKLDSAGLNASYEKCNCKNETKKEFDKLLNDFSSKMNNKKQNLKELINSILNLS